MASACLTIRVWSAPVTPASQGWVIALRRSMCGRGKANFTLAPGVARRPLSHSDRSSHRGAGRRYRAPRFLALNAHGDQVGHDAGPERSRDTVLITDREPRAFEQGPHLG